MASSMSSRSDRSDEILAFPTRETDTKRTELT